MGESIAPLPHTHQSREPWEAETPEAASAWDWVAPGAPTRGQTLPGHAHALASWTLEMRIGGWEERPHWRGRLLLELLDSKGGNICQGPTQQPPEGRLQSSSPLRSS